MKEGNNNLQGDNIQQGNPTTIDNMNNNQVNRQLKRKVTMNH